MFVYRLTRKKYKVNLSGKGAAMEGGRWNPKGAEIIYTAQSRALAMAEIAVHLSLATLPNDFVMLKIEIPNNTSISKIFPVELPDGWNSFPYSLKTQKFGNKFLLDNSTCLLKVPSAVVKGDFNILINPWHLEFKAIKIVEIEDFPFDKRIFE